MILVPRAAAADPEQRPAARDRRAGCASASGLALRGLLALGRRESAEVEHRQRIETAGWMIWHGLPIQRW